MKSISTCISRTFLTALAAAGISAAAMAQTPVAPAKSEAGPAPTAARVTCDDLKKSVEAKLTAHGVKQYSLEIVDAAQSGDGKIVGQCNGGKSKLVYTKGGPAASK